MSDEAGYLALRGHWREMVNHAIKDKKSFQDDADECMRYFDGPYDFLYGDGERLSKKQKLPRPSIKMTINPVAEGVQIFGPSFYFKNPICKVSPRKAPELPLESFGNMQDPRVQQQLMPLLSNIGQQQQIDTMRAALLHGYLNYLPVATNLKESSRDAIDEAIIKGFGIMWAGMMKPAGGRPLPYMEYDTVDNLLIDPDYETMGQAKWIMRRFVRPTWQVEAERGLEYGTIKGSSQSSEMDSAEQTVKDQYHRTIGKTNDLCTYWGIWSKMGTGGLLKGVSKDAADVDRFGRYVYMEVCEGYEYLLNVPKDIWENEDEVRRRLQWETPFWCDVPSSNGWPFTPFIFHKRPRKLWPMSHFKPGMGHIQFMCWATSFLISGIQKRSRDFIAIAKAAGEELKRAIKSGDDLEFIEIEGSLTDSIDKVVHFLQHPEFQKDIMPIVQWQQRMFERSTGLNELMYGQHETQDRSATESKIKEGASNVRPDDMANTVEDAMTDAFRKLALMSRWHMKGEDIGKLYGPVIGNLWKTYVETADPDEIIGQLEYRIEAGSTRKPNKNKDQDDAKNSVQTWMPLLQQAAQHGDVAPSNSVIDFWGKAFEVDTSKMHLQPPPPPPPGPPPPSEEQHNAAAAAQNMTHAEMQHRQDLKHADEAHKLAMKQQKEKAAAAKNGSK